MQIYFTLKNDVYRKKRGGYSRFLNVFCDNCGARVVLYQKDGPGELKRMYLDRITAPKISSSKKRDFICSSCQKILGTFFVYEKEKRKAIRLYQGAVYKKISKGIYRP